MNTLDSELWKRFCGSTNESEWQEAIVEIGRRLRDAALIAGLHWSFLSFTLEIYWNQDD